MDLKWKTLIEGRKGKGRVGKERKGRKEGLENKN